MPENPHRLMIAGFDRQHAHDLIRDFVVVEWRRDRLSGVEDLMSGAADPPVIRQFQTIDDVASEGVFRNSGNGRRGEHEVAKGNPKGCPGGKPRTEALGDFLFRGDVRPQQSFVAGEGSAPARAGSWALLRALGGGTVRLNMVNPPLLYDNGGLGDGWPFCVAPMTGYSHCSITRLGPRAAKPRADLN